MWVRMHAHLHVRLCEARANRHKWIISRLIFSTLNSGMLSYKLMFRNNVDTGKEVVDRKPYKYVLSMLYCYFIRNHYICCILQLCPAPLSQTVLILFQTTLTPGHYWRLAYYWRPGLLLENTVTPQAVCISCYGVCDGRTSNPATNT